MLFRSNYGTHYFFYVKDKHAHCINNDSHDNARGAEWDPTGRCFITFSTSEVREENDSYNIYNCFGEVLFKEQMPKLLDLKWRQRPMTELSLDIVNKITKELPEYAKRFKEIDKQAQESMHEHMNAEKKAKLDKFIRKYLGPKLEKYEKERPEREKILGHPEFIEDDYIVNEYYEEILLDEKIEEIQ